MPEPAGPTRSDLVGRLRADLFWDTDPSQLDAETHAQFIIERVAERGELEEMRAVWSYYGETRVADAVRNSRSLSTRTVWFFSSLLHVPLESFRSYTPELRHGTAP
jgi:hypothetical protein